jgi:hypothetical protein
MGSRDVNVGDDRRLYLRLGPDQKHQIRTRRLCRDSPGLLRSEPAPSGVWFSRIRGNLRDNGQPRWDASRLHRS